MKYIDYIKKAMDMLVNDGYIFIGQSLLFPGTGLYHTIKHLPEEQRYELPIFEDIQAGISIGMALEGIKVCSIFPRIDFMILALNQLILHADKIKEMSENQFTPKFIVRTAIGSISPLFPGCQHNNDFTEAFKLMCKNINIVKLEKPSEIIPAYTEALKSDMSSIIIEIPDLYEMEE